ncbi:MAG TPA: phosphate-starvation-inducible PsiE family protein [Bacteroidales bacterium]|nr:phosphate-starvation-inducible PsiE family protein [Bacteroidales bacterium]HPR57728.1 phosphate-starvation-inducible PsiE family protein [Bacteroidales bacterium]HRW96767.1 phosphate-starvation-inducible PsiE family protein [Bacteroidales bacterium]
MMKIIKQSEKAIIITLIVLMTLMLVIATINLGITVFEKFLEAPRFLITPQGLMSIYDSFLIVLIGIELLETIRTFLKDNVVHVEVVMLVAIIAIARKVIIIDYEQYSGLELIGIGGLIITLSLGYYFIRKALYSYCEPKPTIIQSPKTHQE